MRLNAMPALRLYQNMAKKNLHFHIRSGDYFGTLATVLDLLRQDLGRSGHRKRNARVLKQITRELLYLQSAFKIVKSPGRRRTSRRSVLDLRSRGFPPDVLAQ
jgi:hypothetical protein